MRYYLFIPSGGTIFSILLFLVFFIKEASMNAQANLVLNPSFEEFKICPFDITPSYEISDYIYNWSVPSFSSTDYYNTCSSGNASVPNNYFGHQEAKEGNAYIGIYVWVVAPDDGREYIMGELSETLKKNNIYCVSFYVSLADGRYTNWGYTSVNVAIENIGLYFSADSLSYAMAKNLPFTPHIKNTNGIITDTENWVEISGTYKANGGEKWIIIGNFNPDSTTNKLWLKPNETSMSAAYYYIDDVSVVLCDNIVEEIADTFSLQIPNIFSPNADGLNDIWQVKANGVQQLCAAVYNRLGSLLWQQEVQSTDTTNQTLTLSWDGCSNSGLPVSAGTYYYLVTYTTSEGEVKKEKGFLTIVR